MTDNPRGAGGAIPAGTPRDSASNDKCNRLFENLRRAMAAESAANDRAIKAQNAYDASSPPVDSARKRYKNAEDKWWDLWRDILEKHLAAEGARKRWRAIGPTLTGEQGIWDWDAWNREKEHWLTAEQRVVSPYSPETVAAYAAIDQEKAAARQDLDAARAAQGPVWTSLNEANDEWNQAALDLEIAMNEYQRDCGSTRP